ncbi:S9 family peptidase [Paludibaculum fermentans]|uniref:Prolyl oligopeptidase family serine peptidase n=1 Tax=Paludibaculum fermentans TaxID=1473598 RepID=A0A7S7NLB1_PALFE|nr:alpha/beta fold hydrolase [Paludibaculum fermentans]QOY85693.1 prolyl oligopeptidase family serine peptidase [Paludibaculum fermentans]
MSLRWIPVLFLLPLQAAPGSRPLTPKDVLRLEQWGETAAAPDGQLVAFVRIRARTSAANSMRDFMNGNDRADIWISSLNGAPRPITNGAADDSGFFQPVWSPDGRRLAMLSTRGNKVRLWVWTRATGALRLAAGETVEIARPVWIGPAKLLCATPPPGRQPGVFSLETQAPEEAMRAWPLAWAGRTSTASVLNSGEPLDMASRPQGRLLQFDLTTGAATQLQSGNFTNLTPSPDGRHVAMLELTGILQPEPGRVLPNRNPSQYSLVVVDAQGRRLPLTGAPSNDVLPASIQWSPAGGALVCVANTPEGPRVSRFDVDGVSLRLAPSYEGTLASARGVQWAPDGRLLVQVRANGRADWLVAGGPAPANLTSSMTRPPSALVQFGAKRELAAVADGRLWVLRTGSAAFEPVGDAQAGPRPDSIVWPTDGSSTNSLVVMAARRLFAIDTTQAAFRLIESPSPSAQFAGFLPQSSTALFKDITPTGSFLWTSNPGAAPRRLQAANQFLEQIAAGTLEKFEYAGPDGKPLIAWCLRPPGYEQGKRYPTVFWLYAGLSFGPEPPPFWVPLNSSGVFNLQLLAARGYVVVMPSIPLAPEGQPSDPYLDIPKAVLPAVDKAVDLGIADPHRLAVMGHSYGGYSTYAMITQSPRFQAAIALGGFCNLVSLYGQLDPRHRYAEFARDRLLHMPLLESGQDRMGGPPSQQLDRYLRNSPITQADRVITPVLIVQGDQDYVPIQQGEEFFTALYRQNKPTGFVRYWGEGHVLESPANIEDVWKRIFAWLERYLR